jgi:hypothetical protein
MPHGGQRVGRSALEEQRSSIASLGAEQVVADERVVG